MDDVVNKTNDHLRRMRYFRKQYDQRRSYFYRQYIGQRDTRYYPDNITPRSNTFVPYPLSNVETIVSRIMDAFFAQDPWFECNARSMADDGASEAMGLVLHYMLKHSDFIQSFEELVRNICIYGHAALKVDWDYDFEVVMYKEPILAMQVAENTQTGQKQQVPVLDPNTGQPIILGVRPAQKLVPKNLPKFTAIDVYDLLVDPDGGIVAHLTERTLGEMKKEAFVKPDMYLPEGLAKLQQKLATEKDADQLVIRIAEVWNEYEQTCTILTFGEDAEAVSWKDLRASLRAASYSPYKRKVYGGEPILLYHGPNQYPHRRAPILHTSFIKLPNELYGLGAVEIISEVSESLNKFVNMISDNWNLGINRRYAYDINVDIDHNALNNFNVPGGKVGVSGKPNEAIMELPQFTPQAGDYQILELYRGMIESTSGVSDFYSKGVGSPTNNKTATGITSVMSESNYRFKMFIRNLELDILQPLLGMVASLIQSNVTDQVEVQITNAPPGFPKGVMVQPEQLIGNFTFDLIAANYATNKMIRQRNLMGLIQLIGPSPYINEYNSLLEMGKVFEIRNMSKLLKPPQQVQMEQEAAEKKQIEMMIFEAMLNTESKARLQQSKPQPAGAGKGKTGRPPTRNFGGAPKGAGLTTAIKSFAQGMGLNSLGLEGLGESSGSDG